MANAWAYGDDLRLASTQRAAAEGVFRILVEKDLACVMPRPGEDDQDVYPNSGRSLLNRTSLADLSTQRLRSRAECA